jgi:hypothetical protein
MNPPSPQGYRTVSHPERCSTPDSALAHEWHTTKRQETPDLARCLESGRRGSENPRPTAWEKRCTPFDLGDPCVTFKPHESGDALRLRCPRDDPLAMRLWVATRFASVTQSKDRTGRVSPPQGRGESEDASQPGKSAFAVKRAGPPLSTPGGVLEAPCGRGSTGRGSSHREVRAQLGSPAPSEEDGSDEHRCPVPPDQRRPREVRVGASGSSKRPACGPTPMG